MTKRVGVLHVSTSGDHSALTTWLMLITTALLGSWKTDVSASVNSPATFPMHLSSVLCLTLLLQVLKSPVSSPRAIFLQE